MRTYTESELLKVVEYACSTQKAEDYSISSHLLILDDKHPDSFIHLIELERAVIYTLDILAETDTNEARNITIEDINDYLDESK